MSMTDPLSAASEALIGVSGADWGDVYLKRGNSRSLYFSDGKIEETSSRCTSGCSVRLLRGKHTAIA
ncbi:MAG: hypothetical protein IJU32_02020, partial [Pyramidobacter sp.]|nr:hypothetical protein [Pyramidobacter sp.]